MIGRALFGLLVSLLVLPAVSAAPVNFERDVAPLLAQRCLGCHAGGDPQGSLDLTTLANAVRGGDSGPALQPKNLEESALWQRVVAGDMPPKQPLSAAERDTLKDWILAGAEWTLPAIDPLRYSSEERAGYDWWSWQPSQRPTVPTTDDGWGQQPIDGFIAAQLTANGLTPNPEASRRVLIRRLSFDLTGLPPSPEEVEQFLQDTEPGAYERLVDHLLSSPHYGERWARHWLDVVRFGESNGFERDLPREQAWHYRDWVVDAFNRDLPYDQFVRWQLAADAIAPDDPQALAAMGFLVAGPHDTVIPVSNTMRQTMRQDELEDLVGVVGQTFLGLTLNCARCHDHKFDPVSSREYYQFAAAFGGLDHSEQTVIPAASQQQLTAWAHRIEQLESQLKTQAEPILARLHQERSQGDGPRPASVLPAPLSQWDFTTDLQDQVGSLHARWVGTPQPSPEGIVCDGSNFVATGPLPKPLTEKTLEVRVKLTDLEQRGGGVMSVQTLDGSTFDAVVFGEQQPQRWMAGSNNFQRTNSFNAPAEEAAAREFVTITLVYRANGQIQGYRNGQPYGRAYSSEGPVAFPPGQSQIVFGLRHGAPGGNRMLKGTISHAKLYDRALTDPEVAVSASTSGIIITEDDILAQLSAGDRTVRRLASDELRSLKDQHAALSKSAPYKIYTASKHQPPVMHVLRRGDVSSTGDVVTVAGLTAMTTLPADLGLRADSLEIHRRERLADWITDARNPLFARVMVNRLWHYHFGQGLVATPNDLGFNGGHATHPELLDWLASEFIASGYSLKHMQRLMVTSATYRQSSEYHSQAAASDADNRWLWRMPPRRLDAESLRDAMLSVTQQLNEQLGGKSFHDFHSYFFKGTQFYDPVEMTTYDQHRRTIYRMWARGGRNPFLDTFDCPDPSTSTPKRSATTTPLQALSLLNSSFSRQMADRLAARIETEAGPQPAVQIQRAYELLFSRPPTAAELTLNQEFLTRHGLAMACLAWLNSSEFLYVD
ncbi:DUF1553 domain-containing protein [bacterium]|nr:DUF1553 domain-containing protein [bacterium]